MKIIRRLFEELKHPAAAASLSGDLKSRHLPFEKFNVFLLLLLLSSNMQDGPRLKQGLCYLKEGLQSSFILDPHVPTHTHTHQSSMQQFLRVGEAPPTDGYTTAPPTLGVSRRSLVGALTLVLLPDCLLLFSHGCTAGRCSAGSRLPVCRSPL